MTISIPFDRTSGSWSLGGTISALGAYHGGLADMILHTLLDWYPVVATLATKIAPEFDFIPVKPLHRAMVVLAVVVVLWRSSTAARDTVGRFLGSGTRDGDDTQ